MQWKVPLPRCSSGRVCDPGRGPARTDRVTAIAGEPSDSNYLDAMRYLAIGIGCERRAPVLRTGEAMPPSGRT